MRENVIEFLRDEKTATVTFTQGRFVSKIKKLSEEKPDKCQITAENRDGSIVAHVPVSWIRIQPNRELSEEEKEIYAERARQMVVNRMPLDNGVDRND